MSRDAYRTAMERFSAAAAADEFVLAAFLGGSYAAGRATETSDLDVYVVTRRDDYDAFWARRHDFVRSEEHTSELQSHLNLVCRLLLEKKKPMARKPDAYLVSNTPSHHSQNQYRE